MEFSKKMRKSIFLLLTIAAMTPQITAARGYFDECPSLYRLVEDPEFIDRVARENGMTSSRFYTIETAVQVRMILAYGQARDLCKARGYFDECPVLYRMVEDPDFVARVARANGMSSTRFYSIETPVQAGMIITYGKTRDLCDTDAVPLNGTPEKVPAGRRKP